jgi:hypothetical protein
MTRPSRPGPESPVVGLDLDGTLGDYHEHFLRFARQWTGRDLVWDPTCTGSFAKQLGMGKENYRRCKLAYRRGGLKRSMPVVDGARDLTRSIREAGAQVWFCTTRPYLSMEGIDLDTRHWSKRNGLQFDHMLLGEHKYRDLKRQAGDRVVCVLDDDAAQLDIAQGLGFPPIMVRNRANLWYSMDRFYGVQDLKEAKELILWRISNWKAGNGYQG